MFNKIIKRGHRKVSKSDANEASLYGYGTSAGYPNPNPNAMSNITVVASSVANSMQQVGGPAITATGIVEILPLFTDVSVSDRQTLFLRKLHLCCILFDFSDTLKSVREKEIKRGTLLELVNFIQSGSGKISETVQEELVRMVSINIFRCLPPTSHENTGTDNNTDPEDDDPYLEPSWSHLQIIYELLLRYIVSSDTDTKIAKRYIDHSFVLKLLDLFDSEDPREREYLKTILHRIYGKFMVHRPFVRKAINNIFYRFIFETQRHSGIGELLEILGSIINGFALPMKEEHKLFLIRALIPLHKPKSVGVYHQQLSYCITQFVEKDYKLADTVIRGLLKYWPIINCQKEVLFLGELEEVLEATQGAEFQRCMVPLFRQIGRCLNSSHFQKSKSKVGYERDGVGEKGGNLGPVYLKDMLKEYKRKFYVPKNVFKANLSEEEFNRNVKEFPKMGIDNLMNALEYNKVKMLTSIAINGVVNFMSIEISLLI
ncbi:hypothetical protein GIB67_018021 [Kingdonia uniflora]|uniref:Serine/threonine protein phosphatase 2A regulatory subunit n=1 Tax=Kingdonia uniflora TaxID=39325 RepID=A0A7J7NWC6_9MAGN|nr:hypothetical protein GIB67_018021 [Kingdonia uniflora]